MTDVAFPGRDEVLAGRPGKRADALVFLIEGRTAQLVARSRRAMQRFAAEGPDEELAYFEAFGAARQGGPKPTVQQLERHAEAWSDLVPSNPRLQAAVAQRLGRRYALVHAAVPGIRSAVGLDDPAVRKAYVDLYGEPLETVYAERIGVAQRLRWSWSALAGRLENLPPFWSVYAMALTETVGATILALPIALATIGPLPGVAVLVALGLVNIATVTYMAESVARSGPMRHGGAYIGRVVGDFLGPAGSLVLSLALFAVCLLVLPVFYIGVATTLADVTGVSAPVWVLALFAVNVLFLGRDIGATVGSALLIGAVNIGLIIALSVVALAHLDVANLTYTHVPFVGGRPFEAGLFGLVFGVVLAAYFGHTSAVLCGRAVLHRDPSGRALVRGCIAAQVTAIALYCVFVVAVNGAVAPDLLAAETGTALSPLAREGGAVVLGLGAAFVILGMGMVSVHFALALFNLVRERLPAQADLTVWVPRQAGAVLFRGRFWPRTSLALAYLGAVDGAPRFRVELTAAHEADAEELAAEGRGAAGDLIRPALLPERWRRRFGFEVLEADGTGARVRVVTTLRVADGVVRQPAALGPAVIAELPDELGALLGWILRRGPVGAAEVARHMDTDENAAAAKLRALAAAGLLTATATPEGTRYRAMAGARRARRLPDEVWAALDADGPAPVAGGNAPRRRGLGARARFVIAASPVALAFAGAEWMLVTGTGSFAALLAFAGVVVVSLLGGIFPVMLVAASRRKGWTVPASTAGVLARPVVLAIVYALFLGSVLVHGLFIWDGLLLRAGAIVAGAGTVALTLLMWRRGAFAYRLTIEVVEDERDGGRRRFRIDRAGTPLPTQVVLDHPDETRTLHAAEGVVPAPETLRRLCVTIPQGPPGVTELKVWVHRVTAAGDSLSLRADADVVTAAGRVSELASTRGEAVLPITGGTAEVCLRFHPAQESRPTPG